MNLARDLESRTGAGLGGLPLWLLSFCAALCLVLAWWYPSTRIGAALAWCSIPLWILSSSTGRSVYSRAFLAGALTYCGGFYWLFSTISVFGGFPFAASAAIFALFVFGSAIQFPIFVFALRHSPEILKRVGLSSATAWLVAQWCWIRIFPWDFGHTQAGFPLLAQIADIGGVWLITVLMFWWAECLTLRKRFASRVPFFASSLSLVVTLVYGQWRITTLPQSYGIPLRTVLVQGNVSIEQKNDMKYFSVNRERYEAISREVTLKDSLIVWPESTITDFIPSEVGHADNSDLLPHFGDGSAFLVGGLTYRSDRSFFNSSILVRPDGSVPPPYNKRILMPFGEYTPLGEIFPFIKEINSTAAQFSRGSSAGVLEFPLSTGETVKLSPLICYEDVVPELAREGVLKGGALLVNQTNDAWFGDSVAPLQHHMIATFRAIENRRFLLRSTNTGLTAVVDPVGRTLMPLPPYTESVAELSVNLVTAHTFYTRYNVELLWRILALLVALSCIASAWRKRRTS